MQPNCTRCTLFPLLTPPCKIREDRLPKLHAGAQRIQVRARARDAARVLLQAFMKCFVLSRKREDN